MACAAAQTGSTSVLARIEREAFGEQAATPDTVDRMTFHRMTGVPLNEIDAFVAAGGELKLE